MSQPARTLPTALYSSTKNRDYWSMARSSFFLSVLAFSLCLAACSETGRGGGTPDAAADATPPPPDTAPTMCTADSDCDDGIDCTNDACAVGGICRNTPDNALCSDGEICSMEEGCVGGCEEDSDCDDGVFCNGTEICVAGGCFTEAPADCDDGNACTDDRCDETVDGCVFEPNMGPGCDSPDAGMMMAGPFDPAVHYAGEFTVAPAPSLGCGGASYSFGSVTFSTTGGALRVQAGGLSLTQTATPSTASFDVQTSRAGCANYRLQGEFTDSDTFSAQWTVTIDSAGACSFCPNQNQMIFAARNTP